MATANGTATAGSDYTPGPDHGRFAARETTKKVSVPLTGDSTAEGNETFVLNLSSQWGAVLADSHGAGDHPGRGKLPDNGAY